MPLGAGPLLGERAADAQGCRVLSAAWLLLRLQECQPPTLPSRAAWWVGQSGLDTSELQIDVGPADFC